MSSRLSTDPIHQEQRKPKQSIKFQITLTEEQKNAKRIIMENDITLIKGQAGSAKTTVAVITGLDLLFKKEVNRIIIVRAMVPAGEEVGFLPGDISEKMLPFTSPVFDLMGSIYSKEKIESLIKEEVITVIPFAFLRGHNFSNCYVIVDETQNATSEQLKLVMTRLCNGSKYAICGDSEQIDLKDKNSSGFEKFYKNSLGVQGIGHVELKENFRAEIVKRVLGIFDNNY